MVLDLSNQSTFCLSLDQTGFPPSCLTKTSYRNNYHKKCYKLPILPNADKKNLLQYSPWWDTNPTHRLDPASIPHNPGVNLLYK